MICFREMNAFVAFVFLCAWITFVNAAKVANNFPVVVNTWNFSEATEMAFQLLTDPSKSAVDGVELGCTTCEILQCDGTVGYGGSPDESSETTLDSMIMDGTTMAVGSVGNLRRVKNAVGVARAVMDYTEHTLLAGDQLTQFAVEMGFELSNLSTPSSIQSYNQWKKNECQPNYRMNVVPNPRLYCGPYKPNSSQRNKFVPKTSSKDIDYKNHDTIAMIAIDLHGRMASATSTNGASHKIPGRIGDSPIVGAGSYVDNEAGGCGATGDGDIMMRFLPCYQVVESMRRGMNPKEAAEDAMARIRKHYPTFQGGLVALNNTGGHGGAANGWVFVYAIRDATMSGVEVVEVRPPDYEPN